MHEEGEIHDRPRDNLQQTISPLVKEERLLIKKKLIEAFMILTQSSPAKQSLTQCHKIINHYQKRNDILEILFELMLQFHQQNETLTKLIITQIFTYMKKQLSFGFEQRHDKFKIAKIFLQFYTVSDVSYKFKKMTQNTFMQFIYATQNVKIREEVVKWTQEKLTKVFTTTQKSLTQLQTYNQLSSPISLFIPSDDISTGQNILFSASLIHVLRCLFMGGNLELELMKSILPNCISIYFLMMQNALKRILAAMASNQQDAFAYNVEDCSRFTEIFILMFSKTDTGKFPTLRERFLHTKEIYNLILALLALPPKQTDFNKVLDKVSHRTFQYPGKQFSQEEASLQVKELLSILNLKQTFISDSILAENLDEKTVRVFSNLISIKKNSIQILIKCVKSLQKKKKQPTIEFPYLTVTVVNLWLQIKDCLVKSTQNYLKSTEILGKNQSQISSLRKQYQDLLGSCIKYLSQVTNLSSLYNIVSPYQNQVIFQICFPWLISRHQHDRFQAEDYLFFREDIVNKQNMSYIENNIGNLLESYLDNIDGVITLIMTKCTALISYHITKNPQLKQILSSQLENCWALQFYSAQRQIESALTLIAVQSYLSLRRNDIAILLQRWLLQHKSFFLNVNNDYRITIQFLMMYSYYIDNFYANTIKGISSQHFEFRPLHKEVLKFCCYLMKENYDYQKNAYKGKIGQILFCSALDCLNNSFNHTEIVPALYLNFPPKEELSIPNYLLPYENYPFYPIKKIKQNKKQNEFGMQVIDQYNGNKKDIIQQEDFKQILVHYRKLGLNRDEYIEKDDLIQIMEFLGMNLTSRGNIKIMEIFIQVLINYIKQEMKNQGSTVNIPIVFRDQIATLLACKIYGLFSNKNQKSFPNRGLFQAKATQLIYVLHSISIDPFFIYSLGMDVIWMHPDFWNFDPTEDDNNIDKLLKCTDLVVRLAQKHYTPQKPVNTNELLNKIAEILLLYSYKYILKIHKFNILFGIFLNIILLKVNPEKMMEFLYLLITQKLMRTSDQDQDDQFEDQQDKQDQQDDKLSQSSTNDLLSQAFYLLLLNIYLNPKTINTEKNIQILKGFYQYLTQFVNAHKIVTQLGDVFGKIFACSLCIMEKQYVEGSLGTFDKNMMEFLWRNTLYSGKIYKTELQNRVVSLKLLSLIRQIIKRNDPQFSLERVELMYQIACSCVFYSRNRETLLGIDAQGPDENFDHDGEQQEWQNFPITMKRNDTELYLEDQVLLLKQTSRQLLQSSNLQIKQWIAKLIESLPIAVKNFVKNKVINYEKEAKQVGLRKIIKVKRPENEKLGGLSKQQIIKENIQMRKEKQEHQSDQN